MTTLLRRYPSLAAALDAVAAVFPDAVSPAVGPNPRAFVSAGLRASGERWDVQVAPVLAPTGRVLSPPEGGAQIEEMAPTGAVDVALYWQGAGAPDLAGDTPAQTAAPDFAQPPANLPPLVEAQRAARARVVAYADAITARVTARYPATEVASWPTQAIEARAIKAGAGAADAPLLSALAAAWGMTLAQIADVVLAKAAAYTAITAAVIQIRDAAMRAIDAAPDVATLEASLAAVRAQADAAAAQMGIG